MTELKIREIPDEKPVKMTVALPADLHRDLLAYAALLSGNDGTMDPARLVAPMLRQFMMSDKGFTRARRKEKGPSPEK
ncbi:putative transposase [Komagataeibacter xylinus E25]|nr:putative transposase [Komagataeibacter xylinus E25]